MAKFDDEKKVMVKYTSRDFNTIKRDLVSHAKRYYPDSYKDFSEASFGSLMMDTVAYIGDMLSFYLDYQVNESFLDTANEYSNVVKLSRQLGYKYQGKASAYGFVNFFAKVPANSTGLGPDANYIPVMTRGSQFTSTAGESYFLLENVDFGHVNNEMVVGEINSATGLPTHYIIKAKGMVVSGQLGEDFISVGDFKSFRTLRISENNIAEIMSVTDSEGHEYFEVEHLSQDIIFRQVRNVDENTKEKVPMILKPVGVPRRFVVESDRNNTFILFGYGSEEDIKIDKIVDPTNVILNQYARDYVTTTGFDPSNLLGTGKFGVCPVNTTLRVVYRANSSRNPNAAVGSVNQIANVDLQFGDLTGLDAAKIATVRGSLECYNDEPIIGNVSLPSAHELKVRTKNNFAAQNRAVTKKDYKALVYSMPTRFGAFKRVAVHQDPDSFKRNLNIYVISEDENGSLETSNSALKQNLKFWLDSHRMVNDSIDIIDAKIVNFGIEFTVVSESNNNKFDVLDICLERLRRRFSRQYDIAEPFSFTEVYTLLNRIEGVADTTDVRIFARIGGQYSTLTFDFDSLMTADGRLMICPLNCIYEVKFPLIDVIGNVK